MCLISVGGDEVCEGETLTVLPCFNPSALAALSRGRVFLKMLTISILMGNIMMEL